MKLLEIFVTSMLIAFSGAVMPGPLFVITVAKSVQRGAKAAVVLVTGHSILEAGVVVAFVGGLARFLKEKHIAWSLGLAGGIMLILMGALMTRQFLLQKQLITSSSAPKSYQHASSFLSGILVSLSNPYWALWWITIGIAYIANAMASGAAGILSFYSGHVAADFIWYVFVGLMAATGKKFLSEKSLRYLFAACGALLVALGGRFLFESTASLIRSQ